MLQTSLSALAVFISTSIDYLFILVIIFSQSYSTKGIRHIYLGQYLGTGLLVFVSLIAAFVFNLVPQDWLVGLLGLIPIYLGIHFALAGEEEAEEEEVIEKLYSRDPSRLFWTVTLLTIASGGDNLGIYIPYFTTLTTGEIFVVILIFSLAIAALCYISLRLARLSFVTETIEKYEKIIVPVVFIGLGIYILLENGTLHYLFTALL